MPGKCSARSSPDRKPGTHRTKIRGKRPGDRKISKKKNAECCFGEAEFTRFSRKEKPSARCPENVSVRSSPSRQPISTSARKVCGNHQVLEKSKVEDGGKSLGGGGITVRIPQKSRPLGPGPGASSVTESGGRTEPPPDVCKDAPRSKNYPKGEINRRGSIPSAKLRPLKVFGPDPHRITEPELERHVDIGK